MLANASNHPTATQPPRTGYPFLDGPTAAAQPERVDEVVEFVRAAVQKREATIAELRAQLAAKERECETALTDKGLSVGLYLESQRVVDSLRAQRVINRRVIHALNERLFAERERADAAELALRKAHEAARVSKQDIREESRRADRAEGRIAEAVEMIRRMQRHEIGWEMGWLLEKLTGPAKSEAGTLTCGEVNRHACALPNGHKGSCSTTAPAAPAPKPAEPIATLYRWRCRESRSVDTFATRDDADGHHMRTHHYGNCTPVIDPVPPEVPAESKGRAWRWECKTGEGFTAQNGFASKGWASAHHRSTIGHFKDCAATFKQTNMDGTELSTETAPGVR